MRVSSGRQGERGRQYSQRVYWLKDPPSKTRAATLTLVSCVLAMADGVVLGNLK